MAKKKTEQFVMHTLEMMESAAWGSLSNEARRILNRLEVEHMERGGSKNGDLICTYDDFVKAGIKRRQTVPLAIEQCVALGFVEITVRGGLCLSDIKRPSRYRLTYVNGNSRSPKPTHEWRLFKRGGEIRPLRLRSARAVRVKKNSPGAKMTLSQVPNGTTMN